MLNVTPTASIDVRDALFDELVNAARTDADIFLISCDQGALGFTQLRENFPSRCFNLGISEQTAIDMASGLAMQGMRPCVYGITNFVSARCYEQISVNLGAMNLPVVIIASGAGLTYASDGPTHHALQDIALLRAVPNMQVFNPGDAISTAHAMRQALISKSPTYIRIEKGVWPSLHAATDDLSKGFGVVREGHDLAIISSGIMTHYAKQSAELLAAHKIETRVVDIFRLKPLNYELLAQELRGVRALVVIEEHSPVGALGELLAREVLSAHSALPFLHLSLPDKPCYLYGSREWIHQQFGLDAKSLCEKISQWCSAHG